MCENINKIQEWQGWIKKIFNELDEFYMDYSYYKQVRDIWNSNSSLHKNSSFIRSYVRIFGEYAVTKIRKQLKPALKETPEKKTPELKRASKKNPEMSLVGLLGDIIEELKKNPQLISKKSRLDEHESYLKENMRTTDHNGKSFSEELVKRLIQSELQKYENEFLIPYFNKKEYIDENLIRDDYSELDKKGKIVVTYADKRISHSDLNSKNVEIPTYEDLENIIDCIFEMANKYSIFLSGRLGRTKHESGMNLSDLFKKPWIQN